MKKGTKKASKGPGAPPTKNWNVFVYLAGDNNLSDEMVWSLLGMQEISDRPEFKEKVSLTAVFEQSRQGPQQYTFQSAKKREFGLAQFGANSPLTGLPAQDTVDQFRYFVKLQLDAQRSDPRAQEKSTSTMVILSGHGDGLRGLLSQGRPSRALSIPELGDLMKEAMGDASRTRPSSKVNVLGFESCAMSVLEVCYQVRDSVEFIIGTESFVQNNGWPYARMLTPLLDSNDPPDVAIRMAHIYAQYYQEYDIGKLSTDIAVVDLAKLDEPGGLVERVEALASQLVTVLRRAHPDAHATNPTSNEGDLLKDALIVARWNAQSYNQDDYVDLWDFCLQLQRALSARPVEAIIKACDEVRLALEDKTKPKAVPVSLYQGPAHQHSHGLSIYFPAARRRYAPDYDNLAFAVKTGWHRFLRLYLEKSQRAPRQEEKGLKTFPLEGASALADTVIVPGVRNPAIGSLRHPEKGTDRTTTDIDGYFKNGPTTWQRDSRIVPPDEDKMKGTS
jgi:Clostripain family